MLRAAALVVVVFRYRKHHQEEEQWEQEDVRNGSANIGATALNEFASSPSGPIVLAAALAAEHKRSTPSTASSKAKRAGKHGDGKPVDMEKTGVAEKQSSAGGKKGAVHIRIKVKSNVHYWSAEEDMRLRIGVEMLNGRN